MKVVGTKGAYVKVQLESGDIGYVPQIMVIERAPSTSASPPPPSYNPVGPVPEYGSVPPPAEPTLAPIPLPDVPSIVPPAPDVPDIVPTVPDIVPSVPDITPSSAPFVAPPPEIPGIGAPVPVE